MATAISVIKNWFKTGLMPTQSQYYAWLDSFRHIDVKVPIGDVDGLTDALNGVVSISQFNSLAVDFAEYVAANPALGALIELSFISPELLSDGVYCIWTIPNTLNNNNAQCVLYDNVTNIKLTAIENIVTETEIRYTFFSSDPFATNAYRLSVQGVQKSAPEPPEDDEGFPYTLPLTF